MPADNNLLHVLHPNAYKAPVNKITGFSSRLIMADIEPSPGRIVRSYIKAFPPGSRGLVNEIVHWIICTVLRLPQPTEAWLLLMPVAELALLWPDIDWAEASDCEAYPCFCTIALDGAAPKSLHGATRLASVIADIMQWDRLFAAIAAHEWMANADANRANYIKIAPQNWALLDGGAIMGGENWTTETLRLLGYVHNKLLHLIWPNGTPPAAEVEKICSAAAIHQHAIEAAMPQIYWWIWELCEQADADVARDWLIRRAQPGWMRERFGT